MVKTVVFGLGWLLLAGSSFGQAIWPQFRGPKGQGVSELPAPPAEFGLAKHLLWSTPLPPGHSSPVVVGQRVFLTALDAGQLHTIALDRATGKPLWRQTAPARSIEKYHTFASPAAPTPLADEQRVMVHFGSFGLLCYDHDGREIWHRALPTPKNTYGSASSPIRVTNSAVIVLDSNDRASSKLLAVNLADGTTAWETARPLSASGWATPMLWEHAGQSQIIVLGARRLVAYDSQSGKDLWWMDGFPGETISVPAAGEDLLFVSAAGQTGPPAERFETMTWADMLKLDQNHDGTIQKNEVPADFRFVLRPELPPDNPGRYYPAPFQSMFNSIDGNRDSQLTEQEFATFVKQWGTRARPSLKAIRPGGRGDVSKSHLAWELRKAIPEIPSPLYYRGRIYLVRDGGFVAAVKAATGQLLFQERLPAQGAYCASPVAAGDRIFLASHDGVITCIDATGEQLKVLASNDLGERIWATPALGDRTIYVRTNEHLFAFADAEPARP